ncbi:Uncharacterised protein [Chromobacterium violaceum]|nr:Uncharacterised protein [Chromobacterium violaceum]
MRFLIDERVPHARGDEPVGVGDFVNFTVCSPRPWG